MKKIILISVLVFVLVLGGAFFVYKKLDLDVNVIKEPIPSARVYQPSSTPIPSAAQSLIPNTKYQILDTINLAVPFTSQAPHANWELPYGELCEEASVLMAMSYIKGWSISSPDFADQKLLEIKTFEENRFGYYKDTTAEETAIIIREFYNYDKVKLLESPTVEDIKKAVAEGKVIIIPAAGQQLGNPYFRQPGPLYHMLVIKGYTKEGNFITNDPGTRRGSDFIYNPNVIMNAIHDWNGGNVYNGRKVIIIVG